VKVKLKENTVIVAEHEEGFTLIKQNKNELWINIKVVKANGPRVFHNTIKRSRRSGRRVWGMGWNTVEKRFSRCWDTKWLLEQRPDIYLWMQQQLSK
jgi:hypothetical protein